jgi:hypothetical protein
MLKFMALKGAPHIYDISRLRVNEAEVLYLLYFQETHIHE